MSNRWKILLTVAVAGIVAFLAAPALVNALRQWHAARLLARYRENPTPDLSDQLADILDKQQVSREKGGEILRALTMPRVQTRAAYAAGRRVTFSLTRRHPVHFPGMSLSWEEQQIRSGEPGAGGASEGGNFLSVQPSIVALHPKPEAPGTYAMQVRYR
jgi:hypothetical protein